MLQQLINLNEKIRDDEDTNTEIVDEEQNRLQIIQIKGSK